MVNLVKAPISDDLTISDWRDDEDRRNFVSLRVTNLLLLLPIIVVQIVVILSDLHKSDQLIDELIN